MIVLMVIVVMMQKKNEKGDEYRKLKWQCGDGDGVGDDEEKVTGKVMTGVEQW